MQRIRSLVPRAIPLLGAASVAGLGIAIAAAQNENQTEKPAQPKATATKPAADQAAPPAARNPQAAPRTDRPAADAQRAAPRTDRQPADAQRGAERQAADGQRAAGLGVQFQGQGDQGLQVSTIEQNSAFGRAGLRQGDRIVTVEGMTFNSPRQLEAFLYSQTGPVPIIIDRGGQRYSIQVAMPAATTDSAWLGVYLEEGDGKADGATITQVYPISPAARAGLQAGDIITQINDQKVAGSSDVVMLVREFQPQAQVEIAIVRDQEQLKVPVVLASRRESFMQHQQFASQQQWGPQGAYQAGYQQGPQQQGHPQFSQQQFGAQHWSQNGRQQGGSGSNFEGIPTYAMHLEHQRREAEQHERIEEEIRLLREEVKKLREELSQRK